MLLVWKIYFSMLFKAVRIFFKAGSEYDLIRFSIATKLANFFKATFKII